MTSPAWDDVVEYLRHLGAHQYLLATDRLDAAIDRDGIGAINDALADACCSLMDRVTFPAGTIDVLDVIDSIALRITELSRDTRVGAVDRLRSLLVFFGSDGLPCAARNDVATWEATDRLHDSIECVLGMMALVAEREETALAEVADAIAPPGLVTPPEGTFTLAWRGPNWSEPLRGVMPRGYTAHITFIGEASCSLRAIFARVASLRDVTLPEPTRQESRQSS
jgi:hypothetical protein